MITYCSKILYNIYLFISKQNNGKEDNQRNTMRQNYIISRASSLTDEEV